MKWLAFMLMHLHPLQDPGPAFGQMAGLEEGASCMLKATPQESEEWQVMQLALSDPRSGYEGDAPALLSIHDFKKAIKGLGLEIEHSEVLRSITPYQTREELEILGKKLALDLHLSLSQDFPSIFSEYACQLYADPSGIVLLPSKTLLLIIKK